MKIQEAYEIHYKEKLCSKSQDKLYGRKHPEDEKTGNYAREIALLLGDVNCIILK